MRTVLNWLHLGCSYHTIRTMNSKSKQFRWKCFGISKGCLPVTPTHLPAHLIINFPTLIIQYSSWLFALYMLYLKYVIFTDEENQQPLQLKMLHFPPNCFFSQWNLTKNASEPLQLLGFLPTTFVHQMLHQCNIFKENFHCNSQSEPVRTQRAKNPCNSRFRQCEAERF